MNEELQDDVSVNDDQVNETLNAVESGAELATATGEDQTKNEDGQEEANRLSQKAINKQHAKFREQERRADGLDKELKTLRDKLSTIETEKGDITIPDLPDPYDEDYEAQISARDSAIMQKATQNAQAQVEQAKKTANMEAAKVTEQERVNDLVSGYDKQITVLGLNPDDIRRAGDTVVSYGISTDVAEFILQQEDGPLITKYLADNPLILDDLRNMQPINAALKINSEIRQAASTLKPQASQTPDPTEILSGNGVNERVSSFISGAKFE